MRLTGETYGTGHRPLRVNNGFAYNYIQNGYRLPDGYESGGWKQAATGTGYDAGGYTLTYHDLMNGSVAQASTRTSSGGPGVGATGVGATGGAWPFAVPPSIRSAECSTSALSGTAIGS